MNRRRNKTKKGMDMDKRRDKNMYTECAVSDSGILRGDNSLNYGDT